MNNNNQLTSSRSLGVGVSAAQLAEDRVEHERRAEVRAQNARAKKEAAAGALVLEHQTRLNHLFLDTPSADQYWHDQQNMAEDADKKRQNERLFGSSRGGGEGRGGGGDERNGGRNGGKGGKKGGREGGGKGGVGQGDDGDGGGGGSGGGIGLGPTGKATIRDGGGNWHAPHGEATHSVTIPSLSGDFGFSGSSDAKLALAMRRKAAEKEAIRKAKKRMMRSPTYRRAHTGYGETSHVGSTKGARCAIA